LARLGGDEFGILVERISRIGDALEIAERLQNRIKAPFTIGTVFESTILLVIPRVIEDSTAKLYYSWGTNP
jgi:GGDEF domain-containing protein